MILARGVSKEVIGPQGPVRILDDINFSLGAREQLAITGVSGSGKSTLVQDVLYAALRKHQGKPTEAPGKHRALRGFDRIAEVAMVDQTPIGKTTRSNPASYVGAFDPIRNLFAKSEVSKERGYTPGTFSFNSGNGRCPTCGGNGFEHVEMQFLSDVYLRCPDCDGKRFRGEVLEVTITGQGPRGHQPMNIAEVLELTISEALEFFAGKPAVRARLKPLADVRNVRKTIDGWLMLVFVSGEVSHDFDGRLRIRLT